jgi:hypothetical protein
VESRTENIGFDGLSTIENLWWYLRIGIPRTMTWLPALVALIGVGYIVSRRQVFHILLIGYVAAFLVTISLPALHWPRWTLQILPVLALFAAHGLNNLAVIPETLKKSRQSYLPAILISLVLITLFVPFYRTLLLNIKWSNYSTRVDTEKWLQTNIPAGSLLMMETFQMAVNAPGSQIHEVGFLAEMYLTPAEMVAQGYDYVLTNEERYQRYYAEKDRYLRQVEFYESLFRQAQLIQEFTSSPTKAGPTIRVYSLSP